MKISEDSLTFVKEMADEFGLNYVDIVDLIQFESKWDPNAKNPYSGAVGLIQFLDASAKDLGYNCKEDLLYDLPTQEAQLEKAVYPWLKRYMPYNDSIDLYMQVFYPAYRYKDKNTQFPDYVKKINPGINTPLDYYNLVKKKVKK